MDACVIVRRVPSAYVRSPSRLRPAADLPASMLSSRWALESPKAKAAPTTAAGRMVVAWA